MKPQYFEVHAQPGAWAYMAPQGVKVDTSAVSMEPWEHDNFKIGDVPVTSRKGWGALVPEWKRGVVYYNTAVFHLNTMLTKVIIHHTNNDKDVLGVEYDQKNDSGYACIAYNFFIDKQGKVFEGRPIEIMGGHAGEGLAAGPLFDPDWGAIGIVLQGDYHAADDPWMINPKRWIKGASALVPDAQLESLEHLIMGLKSKYPRIKEMLLHREVTARKGKTVCPGDILSVHAILMRERLGLSSRETFPPDLKKLMDDYYEMINRVVPKATIDISNKMGELRNNFVTPKAPAASPKKESACC